MKNILTFITLLTCYSNVILYSSKNHFNSLRIKKFHNTTIANNTKLKFVKGFPQDKIAEISIGAASVMISESFEKSYYNSSIAKNCSTKDIIKISRKEKQDIEKEVFFNQQENLLLSYLKENKIKSSKFKSLGCKIYDDVANWIKKSKKKNFDDYFKKQKAKCEDYFKNEEKALEHQNYQGLMNLKEGGEDLGHGFLDFIIHSKDYLKNTISCNYKGKPNDKKRQLYIGKIKQHIGKKISEATYDNVKRILGGGVVAGVKMAYYETQIAQNIYLAYNGNDSKRDKYFRLGKVAGYIKKCLLEIAEKENKIRKKI